MSRHARIPSGSTRYSARTTSSSLGSGTLWGRNGPGSVCYVVARSANNIFMARRVGKIYLVLGVHLEAIASPPSGYTCGTIARVRKIRRIRRACVPLSPFLSRGGRRRGVPFNDHVARPRRRCAVTREIFAIKVAVAGNDIRDPAPSHAYAQ